MSVDYRQVWEYYADSWRVASPADKRALYEKCLAGDCVYADPLTMTSGWDELESYMLDFHRQIPGGHFVTTHFQAHHERCIARWEMRDGTGAIVGVGTSFGRFNARGRPTSMTGFYELPESAQSSTP